MNRCTIRDFRPGDEPSAYFVCLKTGDHGQDGEALYREDPEALGRIFVGPYPAYEPGLSLILEDSGGVCGYALAALDSRKFYTRFDAEWRPGLCSSFPEPEGNPNQWTPVQRVHYAYHHPEYFCPEPYAQYPSHLHIDLLPRVQRQGYGRQLIDELAARLRGRGSPGVHLGVSALNRPAVAFYEHLGFQSLTQSGEGRDLCLYMGKILKPVEPPRPA